MVKTKEDKSVPKPQVNLSRGDSIMIEQFLGKKQKAEKAKQDSPGNSVDVGLSRQKEKEGFLFLRHHRSQGDCQIKKNSKQFTVLCLPV